MGLEIVELVISIEERFGIQIPDDKASEFVTLGDIRDYVVKAVAAEGNPSSADEVYESIGEILRRDHKIMNFSPESRIYKDLHLG